MLQKSGEFSRAYQETVFINVCVHVCDSTVHHEDVDLLRTVLKDCSLVGGLTALHTLEINIIKAGEVSQYGRRGAQQTLKALFTLIERKNLHVSFFFKLKTICIQNESTFQMSCN